MTAIKIKKVVCVCTCTRTYAFAVKYRGISSVTKGPAITIKKLLARYIIYILFHITQKCTEKRIG